MTGIERLHKHVSKRRHVLEVHKNPSYKPKNDDEHKKKKESDIDGVVGFMPKLLQLFITTMQERERKNNTKDEKEDNDVVLTFLH